MDLVDGEGSQLLFAKLVREPVVIALGDVNPVSDFILFRLITGYPAKTHIPRQTPSMYR